MIDGRLICRILGHDPFASHIDASTGDLYVDCTRCRETGQFQTDWTDIAWSVDA